MARLPISVCFKPMKLDITLMLITMQEVLLHNLDVDEDTALTVEEILDRIQVYLREESNDLIDDLAFEERVQSEGETFTAFLADLRHLYAAADGCRHCRDKRLRTRIVAGLRNKQIRLDVLEKSPTPNLEQLIIAIRAAEKARRDTGKLDNRLTDVVAPVEAVSQYKKESRGRLHSAPAASNANFQGGGQKSSGGGNKSAGQQGKACGNCGRGHPPGECPAKGKKCSKCYKLNHFSSVCRGTKQLSLIHI